MTSVTQAVVEQADREAAAGCYAEWRKPVSERCAREGKNDSDDLILAFARHRLASTAALEKQVELLREALRPFATIAVGSAWEDSAHLGWENLTVGDLRRARTALQASTNPEATDE